MAPNELGIRWVLLALYQQEDLEAALKEIMSERDFLMMYCMHDSYMWQCKQQLFDVLKVLKTEQMFNKCNILEEFKEYLTARQLKVREIGQMLRSDGQSDKSDCFKFEDGLKSQQSLRNTDLGLIKLPTRRNSTGRTENKTSSRHGTRISKSEERRLEGMSFGALSQKMKH